MKKNIFLYFSLIVFTITSACSKDTINSDIQENETPGLSNTSPNILLIIADDMGLDATYGYNLNNEKKPNTPNLNKLMTEGIKYTNVWSNPTCTPTRGTIITGKYGFKTGVSKVGDLLNTNETSLQKKIKQATSYKTAVIGKWHLGIGGGDTHPNEIGVEHYAGSLSGSLKSYNNWDLTVNGITKTETSYATTKYTDLAIDWIQEQQQPWFLWLAHNAPHSPYEYPPENLYNASNLPTADTTFTEEHRKFFAMIEAMDNEIGRLLNSMDDETRNNTVIIFVGDNGTGGAVSQIYNNRRVKGSLFQGGINVPMIVSGKNIKQNAIDNSLIGTVDLFATITELATENNSDIHDSVSFFSTFNGNNTNERDYVFSELQKDDGSYERTIRNSTHKYILTDNGTTEYLYNLSENPLENPNLLSTNQAPISSEDNEQLDKLKAELNKIIGN